MNIYKILLIILMIGIEHDELIEISHSLNEERLKKDHGFAQLSDNFYENAWKLVNKLKKTDPDIAKNLEISLNQLIDSRIKKIYKLTTAEPWIIEKLTKEEQELLTTLIKAREYFLRKVINSQQ